MRDYYVTTRPQANGDHEVHTADCAWLPGKENRRYLGRFSTCYGALLAARALYEQVNGCYWCSRECHTS